jgi:hypothetical protein
MAAELQIPAGGRVMTDDPNSLRARLDRLAALVERAGQLPPEERARLERTNQFASLARQAVTQARQAARGAAREAAVPSMTGHHGPRADE